MQTKLKLLDQLLPYSNIIAQKSHGKINHGYTQLDYKNSIIYSNFHHKL